jgi:hypothetical protein
MVCSGERGNGMGPYLTGDISMEAGMLLRSAVCSFTFPPIGLTFCFRKPEISFTSRNVVIGSNKVINKNLDRLCVCTYRYKNTLSYTSSRC